MIFDCVGIGVGPFNLSLACLMEPSRALNAVFLEKRTEFSWHSGMQLPGARIQVSHVKDLVTLADPTNPYSFMNYLKESGRLYHFVNARFPTVLRQEFEDYLAWAFRKNTLVRPGHCVNAVTFDGDLRVVADRGAFASRTISIAVGRVPALPDCIERLDGPAMIHNSDYVHAKPDVRGKIVCVIGGGQSGAEICRDLLAREREAGPRKIVWITRRASFDPLDDSPFANELFTPHFSNAHFQLDEVSKRLALKQFKLASDGISASTLEDIYQLLYQRRFVERSDLEVDLIPNVTLTAVGRQRDGSIVLSIRPNSQGALSHVPCDVAVFCTGYRPAPLTFLGDLKQRFDMVGGEPRIREDFSVVWDGPDSHKIYLQNASRLQRGIADPNLSLNAWRSQVILDSIMGRPATADQAPPFLSADRPAQRTPTPPPSLSERPADEARALL